LHSKHSFNIQILEINFNDFQEISIKIPISLNPRGAGRKTGEARKNSAKGGEKGGCLENRAAGAV